jgi:hypothetical protein
MKSVVKEMLWFWLVVVPLTPAWLPLLASACRVAVFTQRRGGDLRGVRVRRAHEKLVGLRGVRWRSYEPRGLWGVATGHAAEHQEREMASADAGIPLGTVVVDQSSVLLLQLRGPDFEEARGRGCPLEAFVEAQDAGYPVLRFRCTTYGAVR